MGFGVVSKCHQTGDLETKIALTASIPVHAAIESRRRDVPGPRSLGFSGKCRGAPRELSEGRPDQPINLPTTAPRTAPDGYAILSLPSAH